MDVETTLIFYAIVAIFALFMMHLASQSILIGESRLIDKNRVHISLVFLSISFIILLIPLVIRDGIGTDYGTYVSTYYSIGSENLYESQKSWLMQSPSFYALCYVIYNLGADYYVMFAVLGALTLFFFYQAIIKNSSQWTWSLFLFIVFCLYFQAFNQVRQMVAISIIAYSYRYLLENDRKKFFLWVAIAASFHMSAIFFSIVWFVRDFKINVRNNILYLALGVLFYISFEFLLPLMSFIPYVQIYSSSKIFASTNEITSILNFVVRVIMYVLCLLFSQYLLRKESKLKVLYNVAAVCTILQIGAIEFNILGRLTTYFYLTYIFLIPEVIQSILSKFSNNGIRLVVSIFAVIIFMVYFGGYYFSNSGAIGSGYLYFKTWI